MGNRPDPYADLLKDQPELGGASLPKDVCLSCGGSGERHGLRMVGAWELEIKRALTMAADAVLEVSRISRKKREKVLAPIWNAEVKFDALMRSLRATVEDHAPLRSGLDVGDVAKQCRVEGCSRAAYGDPAACWEHPVQNEGGDE